MDDQILNIYRDVLIEKWKVVILKIVNDKFHIVTYLPYEPIMEVMQYGYDLKTMLDHTICNHYILQNDDYGEDMSVLVCGAK